MRALTLLAVLVAGAAAAQPGPTNCRSAAYNCNAHAFYGNAAAGEFVIQNGASWGIWTNSGNATMNFTAGGVLAAQFNGASSQYSFPQNWPIISGATSGNNAFQSVTGARWDIGGGASDYLASDGTDITSPTGFKSTGSYFWSPNNFGIYLNTAGTKRFYSDGTTLLANDTVAATGADTQDLGTTAGYWRTLYTSRGVSLNEGVTVKWTTPPISDNTTRTSQVVFNGDSNEPVYASSSRKYNPLGQQKEWAVEKRWLNVDVGFENANCPIGAPSLKGTGAAAVTFTCTDAAAAGSNTLSGESYRVLNTTTTSASVSIVDVSGNITKRELGPKHIQRISIPSGSTSNVRIWVALVPTATSLTGVDTGAISVIGFRFSTAVPDTNWQACSGDAASVVCTDTGTAPTTGTNLTLEIDCRESSSCRFLINGSLVATRSSTLPATTTQLAPRVLVQTTNTTAKALWHGRSSTQTN